VSDNLKIKPNWWDTKAESCCSLNFAVPIITKKFKKHSSTFLTRRLVSVVVTLDRDCVWSMWRKCRLPDVRIGGLLRCTFFDLYRAVSLETSQKIPIDVGQLNDTAVIYDTTNRVLVALVVLHTGTVSAWRRNQYEGDWMKSDRKKFETTSAKNRRKRDKNESSWR